MNVDGVFQAVKQKWRMDSPAWRFAPPEYLDSRYAPGAKPQAGVS